MMESKYLPVVRNGLIRSTRSVHVTAAILKDRVCTGKGAKVGDTGEQVPAYYQQWADKIKHMDLLCQ